MLVGSKNMLLYPSSFSNWAAVQAGGTRYTGLQPPQLEQAKRGSKHRFPSLVGEDITQHKELLKHPSNSLSVYTDGSGIDNNVGAAAVSLLTGCTEWRILGIVKPQLYMPQNYKALGWPFRCLIGIEPLPQLSQGY